MHIAGLWGNASAVQCLIDNKVDVDKVNGPRLGNQTALHMLASRGNNTASRLLCAQALVKAGANLGCKNSAGETAFDVMQRCLKENDYVANPELQSVLNPQ